MSSFPSMQSAGPQLTPQNLQELAAARQARRKIDRAVGVARFDGWTIGIFAALTFIGGLGSVSGVVLGAGLGAIAYVELKQAERLRRLEAGAARAMGFNQLALAGLLIAYAVWSLCTASGEYAQVLKDYPEVAGTLGPLQDLVGLIVRMIYGGVIAVAVFGQGGLACYYFTRARHVRMYREQTPQWILQMQEAGIRF